MNNNNYINKCQISVLILHLKKNNLNYELLLTLSSKYLEYVPIGGICRNYNNIDDYYKYILNEALRETKEETMNIINDKYVNVFDNGEYNSDSVLYHCKDKYNNDTNYLLFKTPININFSNNQSKKCYIIVHYIFKNYKIEYSYNDRCKSIHQLKYKNKNLKYDLYCIPEKFNSNPLIKKLNDIYYFYQKCNNNIRKIYIHPYYETIQLKWMNINEYGFYLFKNHKNVNNLNVSNSPRLYDNKELYNHLFYSNYETLINYIDKNKYSMNWIIKYLEGKEENNDNDIINYHYRNAINKFINNDINNKIICNYINLINGNI
jgi:hypothetical protein